MPVLLQKIAEAADSLLKADVVVVYEYREETDDLRIPPVVHGKLQQPTVLKKVDPKRVAEGSIVFK